MKNIFKERLKELREDKNMSQNALSKQIKVSQPAIVKWENGERTPTMESLIILATFFDVTIDYLVGLEN